MLKDMKKGLLQFAALLCAAFGAAPYAQADTTLLDEEKGYQKITALPEDLGNYYFILVDKTEDLAMTLDNAVLQGEGYKSCWYKATADPTTALNQVWMLEANNGANNHAIGYNLRNVPQHGLLMQPEGAGDNQDR